VNANKTECRDCDLDELLSEYFQEAIPLAQKQASCQGERTFLIDSLTYQTSITQLPRTKNRLPQNIDPRQIHST